MRQGAGFKLVAEFLHQVQRNVVARSIGPHAPRIGAPLFDERGRKVGIVADVFGPVSRPYILVKGGAAEKYYARERDLIGGGKHG